VLTGTGTVVFLVEDVNDPGPEFSQTSYNAQVVEKAAPGTDVAQLSASDNDVGINALVK
jgi:hypothetical protein